MEGFEISILTKKSDTTLREMLECIRLTCAKNNSYPNLREEQERFFIDFFDNADNNGLSFIKLDDPECGYDEFFAFSTIERLSSHWSYKEFLHYLPRFFDPLMSKLPIAFIYGSTEINGILGHAHNSLDTIDAAILKNFPVSMTTIQRAESIDLNWESLKHSRFFIDLEAQGGDW